MQKKSQGLSFSTIVLAVISIFILVLIILFVSGGLKGVFGPIRDLTPDEISSARNACVAACGLAQTYVSDESQFRSSDYCTKKLPDKFQGEVFSAAPPAEGYRCHTDTAAAGTPFVSCNVYDGTGTLLRCP